MGEVILTMKGIDKSFPGVHALDHVDLEIRKGEVLALMGENGAGKSTLMKVLTGIYKKDSGTITYEGKEVEFANPRDAQAAGVVIVHQELNMMNHLTVAQNIFIGREIMNGKLINDAKMNEEAAKLFKQLNIDIDPKEKMGNLTVGKQQMCEIAKAISHEAKVIIFDEPSAALTEAEIEELFKIIRDLRDKQLGIVYISHRMDEIKVITDRVTVMRDGSYVGTLITKDCTKDDIINMMVGRVIYEDPKTESNVAPDAPVVLKVEHLNAGKMVQDVSFELHKGEILGFSGLMGAGRTETARALFGADPMDSGDIYVNGKKVTNVTKTISKVKYHFDVTGKVVYKKVKNVYYKINSKGKAKKMNQVETLAATRLDMYGGNLKKAFNWSASIPYTANVKVAKKTPGNYGIYGFQRQRGDCYVMAATFYWMAKVSGSDAHYVKGYFKKSSGKGAHAWVEIDYKGTTYVYDPNFQSEFGKKGYTGYKITYGQKGTLQYVKTSKGR